MFSIDPRPLGKFDVAVCGGGVAGAAAAISCARRGAGTILIEADGCLGGIMTKAYMPYMLDAKNKGGIVREFYSFLDEKNMTCPRHGKKISEDGKNIPGELFDIEGAKYFYDKTAVDAGVKLLYHSRVADVKCDDGRITEILISSDCGFYSLSADIFIDATGNGDLAALAGCKWECGEPKTGKISPASIGMFLTGFPEDYIGTDSEADKNEYGRMLREHGIETSSGQAAVTKLPQSSLWDMSVNFEYGVAPDDIEALTKATVNGRRESFEVIEKHKEIAGYERLFIATSSSHIGLREGRRVQGIYRISDDDIIEGRRFEDAVCLVTVGVDVHKLDNGDTTECSRGYKTQPYNIPYRSLVARDSKNLLLAGRCISGDFYPHASYRMMGNMTATGEAAGFAAAECIKAKISPAELDGTIVSAFMRDKGYEL